MKRLVKLSSHGLSDYQKCPKRFEYSILRQLEPRKYNRAFDRGGIIAKMLEDYYMAKLGGILDMPYALSLIEKYVDNSTLDDVDKMLLGRTFMQYVGHYKNDEWKPIACELPFSILLYEDSKYLFMYEGTMDLVIKNPLDENKRIVVDHKTYSRFDEIYPLNNQALGYCYAMKTDTFIYNYFGLTQEKKIADNFKRTVKKFYKQDLETWKETTISWFKRIADDMDYEKSYQCQGKYGICGFAPLCESPFEAARESLIQVKFQHNANASWGKTRTTSKESEDECYGGA